MHRRVGSQIDPWTVRIGAFRHSAGWTRVLAAITDAGS